MQRFPSLRKKSGFTLLELVIVLFFITLILGLTTVYFSGGLSSVRIESAGREIMATMRYARSLARINHEQQIINIDIDAKRYGIEGRKGRNIPDDVRIKIIDPFSGELVTGKYRLVYSKAGSAGGSAIVLWNNKKELNILTDPVMGSVIIR
ncbi:pilus assembly FimT family protein [Desulfobacterium sp. N47]|uniref:Prepilin-type N-terminal cleavage/methylation domain-containing protein n=1 Tax=uncultured Desulfobacterium sp. TaxID=201089 RepID=E1YDL4_9BACT|nr:hypothetical protein N47_G39820 [uncultured Desulfobacterium sp.]